MFKLKLFSFDSKLYVVFVHYSLRKATGCFHRIMKSDLGLYQRHGSSSLENALSAYSRVTLMTAIVGKKGSSVTQSWKEIAIR